MKPGFSRSSFDLTGRVAVVTGGAGILGSRFCAALADHGAKVAVADLDAAAAEKSAAELRETFGAAAVGVGLDVTDELSIKAMAEAVETELGPIDILSNNAATKGSDFNRFFDDVESFRLEVWREIMAVNLDGMFLVAREVGGRMARRGQGSIVQTASIYGIVGPDQRVYEGSEYLGRSINTPAIYSASKAGVVGLTRHLATYWGAQGVRVNTVTPGGVSSGQNAEFERRYGARVPLGRMARPDEIATALVFLCSDASIYMTGHNLVVDGGLSVW